MRALSQAVPASYGDDVYVPHVPGGGLGFYSDDLQPGMHSYAPQIYPLHGPLFDMFKKLIEDGVFKNQYDPNKQPNLMWPLYPGENDDEVDYAGRMRGGGA